MQLGDEASRCLTLETSLERARLTTAQDSARMKESDARITSLHEELAQAREEREQQELKMQIAKEESLTAQQGLELKLTMVAKEKAEVAKRHEELAAHSAEVEAGLQKAQQDSVNMQEEARAEHDKLQQRERELRATARAKHEALAQDANETRAMLSSEQHRALNLEEQLLAMQHEVSAIVRYLD